MIPGSNLFRAATRLIGTTPVGYVSASSRSLNSIGQWVTTHATAVVVKASVQAVDRAKYVQLGLDLQKVYMRLFLPAEVFDLDRDISGDQFLFYGARWQVNSEADWFIQDGWVDCLVVKLNYGETMPTGVR